MDSPLSACSGPDILRDIAAHSKAGEDVGIFSVCTANELALSAAMRHARERGCPLLLEATSNQCNQFGGYTGMTPADFRRKALELAEREGLPAERLILGGDHLGPLLWQDKGEREAMAAATDMVEAYVSAGFDKIHIDTSMRLADDDRGLPLTAETSARRAACLAQTVERSYDALLKTNPYARYPALVVGSEVPTPGGSTVYEDSVEPTEPAQLRMQIAAFREAFRQYGADFKNVVAFVVQPGVEFGDNYVCRYDRPRAAGLTAAMRGEPGLVLEGHSTDYQPPSALRELVEDGVAILKVGPALTFALREGLMLLEHVEERLGGCRLGFSAALKAAMDADESHWRRYYTGDSREIDYKRAFSYSDRCRYYLPVSAVKRAVMRLIETEEPIPQALLSMYFPRQYQKYMNGQLTGDRLSVLYDAIGCVLDPYLAACTPNRGREGGDNDG